MNIRITITNYGLESNSIRSLLSDVLNVSCVEMEKAYQRGHLRLELSAEQFTTFIYERNHRNICNGIKDLNMEMVGSMKSNYILNVSGR